MDRWRTIVILVTVLVGIWIGLNQLALAVQPPSPPEGQYGSWRVAAIQANFRVLEMASPESGWAVATRSGDGNWPNQSLLFEYAGGQWHWRQSLEGPAVVQMDLLSPTDGWLVGNNQAYGTMGSGRAYHYTGGQWNQVVSAEDVFLGIDMVSATDGYVLGSGHLWRVNGTGSIWQDVGPGVYDYPFDSRTFSGFQVLAPQNMWYLTSALYDFNDGRTQRVLYHYDGTSWSRSFADPDVRAFTMTGASDGWLIGNGGKLWHYNGSSWTQVTSPTTADLVSISPVGSTDLWVLGTQQTALHFNGSAWETVLLPGDGGVLAMTGASDGWIAGSNGWLKYGTGGWQTFANGTRPLLGAPWSTERAAMLADNSIWSETHYFDGYQWQPHTYSIPDSVFAAAGPFATKESSNLTGLAMASPAQGWSIGSAVAYTGSQEYVTSNLLYAFDGHRWTAQETPATTKGGISRQEGGGTVQHQLPQSTQANYMGLTDVTIAAPGDLWFTTSGGYVLRYTGGQWTISRDAALLDTDGFQTYLTALDMLSPELGWAVGNRIVHYNGTAWSTTELSSTLSAVDMYSPTLGIAVGNNGLIMRYDGSNWQSMPSPTRADLTSVQLLAPDEAWAVGTQQGGTTGTERVSDTGVILYYDGEKWVIDGYLPFDRLDAVAMLDSERGYLFGRGVALTMAGTPDRDNGTITGLVRAEDNTPLPGIRVLAYRFSGTWYEAAATQTAADGTYTLGPIPVGTYRVFFSDPAGAYRSEYYGGYANIADANDVVVTKDTATPNVNPSLHPYPPPQIDAEGNLVTAVDPETGEVTVLSTRAPQQVTFVRRVTCADGATPTGVTFVIGGATFPMQPRADGAYVVTLNIPEDLPNTTGPFTMSVRYTCNTPQEDEVGEFDFYDPSGQITDTEGQPVAGAVVNLYRVTGALPDAVGVEGDCRTVETRPGGVAGNWSSLPPASQDDGTWVNAGIEETLQQPSISPIANPQVTGADGRYGWDVVAGCWFVVVSAPGYDTLVSPAVGVPPEVTDLNLRIQRVESKTYLPEVKK